MSSVCSEEGQVLKRIPGKEDGNDNSGGAEGGEGKMLSEGEGLFSVVPESPIEGKSVERGSPTIRTPKRRKFNLRDFELVHQMSHLYSGNCCMYLVQMRGPIELIYCNQGLNEAFLNPFMSMYFHSGGSSFEEVGSRNTKNQVIELRKKTKIIAAVPRRINLQTNEPEMKPGSKNDTRRYKKCYFVSYTKDESERSDNDRQEGLWAICNVSRQKYFRSLWRIVCYERSCLILTASYLAVVLYSSSRYCFGATIMPL